MVGAPKLGHCTLEFDKAKIERKKIDKKCEMGGKEATRSNDLQHFQHDALFYLKRSLAIAQKMNAISYSGLEVGGLFHSLRYCSEDLRTVE